MELKAVHGRELGDYAAVVRRRWLVVLVAVLLCFAGGLAYLQVAPKTYVSTAKVLVEATATSSVAAGARTTDTINLDTEAQIVKSLEVANLAREELDPKVFPEDPEAVPLARRVTVTVPPNTTVLDIAFADSSAERAQKGAQAFADAYLLNREISANDEIADEVASLQEDLDATLADLAEVNAQLSRATGDERDDLVGQRSDLQIERDSLQVQLAELRTAAEDAGLGGKILIDAQEPNKPRDPDPMLVLPSAVFLGLLLGLALALWRERVDQRIHASADIERIYGLTPLADLRVILGAGAGRDSRHYDVRALYHSLRANGPEAAEVVLVVAPNSPSIASGVCRALGVAAARSGAVTSYISNERNARGLGPQASGGVLRTLNYRDAELVYDGEINAERLQTQIGALRADNDFVVLGLPSDDPTVDLPMLCRHVDVVLVLVHLGQATRPAVGETLRSLKTARARTVFAVSVDMRRQHLLERNTPLPEEGFTDEPDAKLAERPLSKALQTFGKTGPQGPPEKKPESPPEKKSGSADAPARSK